MGLVSGCRCSITGQVGMTTPRNTVKLTPTVRSCLEKYIAERGLESIDDAANHLLMQVFYPVRPPASPIESHSPPARPLAAPSGPLLVEPEPEVPPTEQAPKPDFLAAAKAMARPKE